MEEQLRIRYVRKQNREKKGVVVAIIKENKVLIGFSLCNNRDRWDIVKGKRSKHFGVNVACRRAEKYHDRELKDISVPQSLVETIKKSISRLIERHEGKDFPIWTKEFIDIKSSVDNIIQPEKCMPRYYNMGTRI